MYYLHSIKEIIDFYDVFLIDLYGVIHDGKTTYPYAIQALEELKAANKKIVFFSNSPNRTSLISERLQKLNIADSYYDHILSAGEFGVHDLEHNTFTRLPQNAKCFYVIGSSHQEHLLLNTAFTQIDDPEQADFFITTIYNDLYPNQKLSDEILLCLTLNKPLLCFNPDMYIIRQDGTMEECAGRVATEYQDKGGEVHYYGKPYQPFYEHAFSLYPGRRFVAVGDSLRTDIKGANHAKIDSIWITGGIHLYELGGKDFLQHAEMESLQHACARHRAHPNMLLPILK